MHYWNGLPRFLLSRPYAVRLGITVMSVLLCLVVYIVFFSVTTNPSILAIPTVLAAWIFKKRGAFLSIACIIVTTLIFVSIRLKISIFDIRMILTFASGGCALVVLGLLISGQRLSFDQSDIARMNEQKLNQQQQLLHMLKDEFILNVNHELRTPLTAVNGYLEMLLQHNHELDAHARAAFLRGALYSCDELQYLIENILGAIQVMGEIGQCQLEECIIAHVVREVVEHFDPRRMQEHHVTLLVPDHLAVMANAQYVRQVLRNLLSNACKYTCAGTPITISAYLHENTLYEQPMVCICMRDAGPGIPPEEVHLLFGQFVRLKRDVSGTVRGTGLGLYVSRRLVEMMRGHIWVESTGIEGEGSCFSFTLPQVQTVQQERMGVDAIVGA